MKLVRHVTHVSILGMLCSVHKRQLLLTQHRLKRYLEVIAYFFCADFNMTCCAFAFFGQGAEAQQQLLSVGQDEQR